MLPVPMASVRCRLKSPCFQSNHLGFGHGECRNVRIEVLSELLGGEENDELLESFAGSGVKASPAKVEEIF